MQSRIFFRTQCTLLCVHQNNFRSKMQCLFGLKGTVPECVRVQGIFPNDPCRSTIAALLRCGSNFFRLYLLPKTQLFCALIRFEKTTGETDLCLAYQTCVRLVQPDTGKALALCFGESLQDPIGIILMHKFNSSERNNSMAHNCGKYRIPTGVSLAGHR